MIPTQLKDCRFIRLGYHSKIPAPGQKGHFNSDTCNYGIGDAELIQHLANGRNYGVIVRNGICVIDADAEALWDAVPAGWKESFTVRSGREDGSGRHLFISCPDAPTGIKVIFPGGIGDIRLSGSPFYIVGAGSIHPDTGAPYTVVNDAPTKEVSWHDLSEFIEGNKGEIDDTEEKQRPARRNIPRDSSTIAQKLGLKPEDFIMPTNPRYVGMTIIGGNPLIGSTTGQNLHIHTGKGLFFDFHQYDGIHKKGGDGLHAYCIARGIISFADLGPGCLDELWAEIFQELESDGYDLDADPEAAARAEAFLKFLNERKGARIDR
jgi:hypothetical protein